MIKVICALCVMALLSGCGAGSLQELQSTPTAKYEFDAPMSYGATYSRINYAVLSCYLSDTWATSWYTNGDLRLDKNRGEVTLSQTNFGNRYFGDILVVPKEELTAHVTVWTARADLQHLGPDAERWAKGDSNCK
ncbi:MAG TPA: hypothetical protein VN229_02380 [Terriglobales bacterium]|nr:hypothetical protein [Terriglobales bacterium]